MQNPFLVSPSIYLRPLEKADASVLQSWMNDPEVRRLLLRYRPLNLQSEEEYIDHVRKSDYDIGLGIAVRETDRLIGATGFHKIDVHNRHACFGIAIGVQSEQDKGYGTEATELMVGYAFDTLNLNKVWLGVFEYNPRAIRTYEKVGFRREGVLRQDNFRDGRYWDTIAMGILREEWQDRKRAKS